MIKDYNHYTIFGWMINRLHLKGTDLKVYAVIYSFSQDGKSEYKGSNSYLADFAGAGERSISRILADLETRGLIEKTADNASTGKVNGWKAVPLEKLVLLGIIELEEGSQNGDPTPAKMATPINKVDKLLLDSNSFIEKERKKIDIDINNIPRVCTRESEVDFSLMSDEELIAWGEETAPDFSDAKFLQLFEKWSEEMEKRKKEAGTKWKGKTVLNDGVRKPLQSHAEIMDSYKIKGAYRDTFESFLRACYANGHLVTNDKLLGIIVTLDKQYGECEDLKIKSIERAISGGYYDIRENAV